MHKVVQYCAPNINNGIDIETHFTCFELEELKEIAYAYNKFIDNQKICKANTNKCVKGITIDDIHLKTKNILWNEIYDRLKGICRYEWCWLNFEFIDTIEDEDMKEKIRYFTFKPKMTPTRYAWLNTTDINYVLTQYEKSHNDFKFLGTIPADHFAKFDIDVNDFINTTLIGLVFNLDTYDQPGSHWVALVVDNTDKTIEYFDSTGQRPTKHIRKFIKNLLSLKPFKKHTFKRNKVEHQKENSECGVYSINFIIEKLKGKSFDDITNTVIPDKKMNKMRNVLFRPRKE